MFSFKKYIKTIEEQNTIGYHNDGGGFNAPMLRSGGSYITSDQSGSESDPGKNSIGYPQFLPSLDMTVPQEVPTVQRTAKIRLIEKHKNPIFIFLSDGTRLYLTYDEFKRIKGGEPRMGQTMKVVFQRNPKDKNEAPSQIQSIWVKD
jgi:hypothetical protein